MARCCEGALLPPSLITQVEDAGAEREEEEGPGDNEGSEDEKSNSGLCAVVEIIGGGGRGVD